MADPKKAVKKKIGGPYLAMAVFCENIVEDQRKVISAIGITEGLQFWISPFAPGDMPSREMPIAINQNILLMFRTGDSQGKHLLKLRHLTSSERHTDHSI